MKKKVLIDMDGVLADFYNAAKRALTDNPKQRFPQGQWGFFLKLQPIKDAIESYKLLEQHFDVSILTRPSFHNVNCYTEKAQWIWDYLGFEALEKAIFAGDKARIKGDYLIDDQDNANQANFEGEWIRFGSEKFPDWRSVTYYLLNKEAELDKAIEAFRQNDLFIEWLEKLKLIAFQYDSKYYPLRSDWDEEYWQRKYFDKNISPNDAWTHYTTMIQ